MNKKKSNIPSTKRVETWKNSPLTLQKFKRISTGSKWIGFPSTYRRHMGQQLSFVTWEWIYERVPTMGVLVKVWEGRHFELRVTLKGSWNLVQDWQDFQIPVNKSEIINVSVTKVKIKISVGPDYIISEMGTTSTNLHLTVDLIFCRLFLPFTSYFQTISLLNLQLKCRVSSQRIIRGIYMNGGIRTHHGCQRLGSRVNYNTLSILPYGNLNTDNHNLTPSEQYSRSSDKYRMF